MKNIYIAMESDGWEPTILAVFSTKEKANKYIEKCEKLNKSSSIHFYVDSWAVDFMSGEGNYEMY